MNESRDSIACLTQPSTVRVMFVYEEICVGREQDLERNLKILRARVTTSYPEHV